MKKLSLVVPAALCICLMQACSGDHKSDSKASADTMNSMKDSLHDSTKAITNDLVMKVSQDDAKFAVSAANGGMAEVVLGKLAQEKAESQQVKEFGAMMVSDHSKANDELMMIAKNKGITLPDSISNDEQKLKADLSAKNGKNFDKAYLDAMVKDHQDDIKDFENAVTILKDPDLKAFATKTLPTLKKHLDAIQKIQGQMK